MQIYIIDSPLIDQGRAAYEAHLRRGSLRGAALIPGAIIAALEAGLTRKGDIVDSVASATRCLSSTVLTTLKRLSVDAHPGGLWKSEKNDCYSLVDRRHDRPVAVMAN